jgi:hypothetical protein
VIARTALRLDVDAGGFTSLGARESLLARTDEG